jgi:hypothetical protein
MLAETNEYILDNPNKKTDENDTPKDVIPKEPVKITLHLLSAKNVQDSIVNDHLQAI